MPAVHDVYADIEGMQPNELQMARDEIVRNAAGNFDSLSVEDLRRLSAIYQVLRRKSAGPPKKVRPTKAKPTQKITLDDIFG